MKVVCSNNILCCLAFCYDKLLTPSPAISLSMSIITGLVEAEAIITINNIYSHWVTNGQ